MEISDTDILSMDECEVDLRVLNAPRLNIRSQGVTLKSIKLKSVCAGYTLASQLFKHQEELNEARRNNEKTVEETQD